MSQCNQCCRTPCECMDGGEAERDVTTKTDPEAIARRIVELGARYQATRSLPLGNSERRDAFLSAMQSSIDDAPTLAAAYLELREEVATLAAENKSLDVPARGERAMVDTASDVIAELRAKLSECAAMGLEACRRLGVQDTENATLRTQLDAVTAQRDELREAAVGYHQAIAESTQMGSFGRRATALARLVTALEAAR